MSALSEKIYPNWVDDDEDVDSDVTVAAAEVHTGAMIALVPTVADARYLEIDGFEPADQLHVTLVYLGQSVDFDSDARQAVLDVVRRYAGAPLTAGAFAVNIFNPDGDEPCLVLGIGNDGGPALEELRSNIYSAVRGLAGVEVADNHTPWLPHLTLAYGDVVELLALLPQALVRVGPVTFDRVRVAFGSETIDIPLRVVTGEDAGEDAGEDTSESVEDVDKVDGFFNLRNQSDLQFTAATLDFHYKDKHDQQSHAGDRVISAVKLTKRVKALENALAANVHKLSTNVTHRDKHGVWSPERDAIHREIVADFYARANDVPSEGRAVLVGGNAGAGKSTVLQKQAGLDPSRFLKIDPDEVKEELARRGLVPELPDGDFSPMERSTLVHRESVRIADMLADRAMRDRKNVIWDGTMADPGLVHSRVERMDKAGYRRIDGVFVDVSDQMSRTRVAERYRRGLYDWVRGQGQGSRFVPSHIQNMMTSADTRHGFNSLRKSGAFDNWVVYDNDVDGQDAKLVASAGRV